MTTDTATLRPLYALPVTTYPPDCDDPATVIVVGSGANTMGAAAFRVVSVGADTWLVATWTPAGWRTVYDALAAATPEDAARTAHRVTVAYRPLLPDDLPAAAPVTVYADGHAETTGADQ